MKKIPSTSKSKKGINKIIVDTNIIFSTLLNTENTFGDLIFNSDHAFEFYSCSYMQYEIEKHWERLKRISKLSEIELKISQLKVYSKINFINEDLISENIWLIAEKLVADIDADDVDFVALTQFINGRLWTKDKILFSGLKRKKFRKIISTEELLHVRQAYSLK